ncbi:MAG: DUF4279 domain-containing protein [Elusimicrobia bacterium]|nr:DUF4279 domain-containing protein [Elusimicrobiota bacterium]MBK8651575.1 DUF4279 domain-containing protein [Elusimicrobiota bacterium]
MTRSEIKLIYRITSEDDDLFALVEKLKTQPNKIWRMGDLIDKRALARYKKNGISFCSNEKHSQKFDAQVESLVRILAPIKDTLEKLSRTCYSELSCVVHIYGDDRPAIHFNKETLLFFANLNADIDIDLYSFSSTIAS